MGKELPVRIETYTIAKWSIYALWGVTLPNGDYHEMAAVVGAPGHLEATADAAGTCRGVATAWTVDASDWDGLSGALRDDVLAVLADYAPELAEEHLPDEWNEDDGE